jgi:hypothetical protein
MFTTTTIKAGINHVRKLFSRKPVEPFMPAGGYWDNDSGNLPLMSVMCPQCDQAFETDNPYDVICNECVTFNTRLKNAFYAEQRKQEIVKRVLATLDTHCPHCQRMLAPDAYDALSCANCDIEF